MISDKTKEAMRIVQRLIGFVRAGGLLLSGFQVGLGLGKHDPVLIALGLALLAWYFWTEGEP